MDKDLEKILDGKRCFIFDLDGTLGNTEKTQWEAHKKVCKDMFNIDLDDEHIYSYLGMADQLVLESIEKDYNIDMGGEKGYEKYKKIRIKTAAKMVLKEPSFKYVTDILLKSFGIQFYLVTAQNAKLVEKMLKNWNLYRFFNVRNTFICDSRHNKMYYYDEIFRLLKNAKPEDVVLFEDVNKYLQEGKKRGYITVGIDNNFGKDPIEADYIIKTQEK